MLSIIANIEAANVAGIVGGGVTVTAAIGYAVKTYFTAKRKDDNIRDAKKQRAMDDADTRASLVTITNKLTQHELDDERRFSRAESKQDVMETKINHISQTTSIMAADLKEVLRRTPRNGAERAGE